MTTLDVEIAEETPLQDDVRRLIVELNGAIAEQEPETPPEFQFQMTAEDMARPDTTVWVVRRAGEALGCCALRRIGNGVGEVKRMYLRPAARGLGLADRMLATIEARAVGDGLETLALETGILFHAAHRVYERAGFERTGAFADYPDSGYAAFYAKTIRPAAAGASTPV